MSEEVMIEYIKEITNDGRVIMHLPPEIVQNPDNLRTCLTDGVLWEFEITQEQADAENEAIVNFELDEAARSEQENTVSNLQNTVDTILGVEDNG